MRLPLEVNNEATHQRLDFFYAKDYTVQKDIAIFFEYWRNI
jgi:hypothetical protein